MLKLGSETGSLVNHIHSQSNRHLVPDGGMGATILHWTDRSAGTIVKVETIHGKVYVHVQGDLAKRIDKNGMSESQTYEYTPDPTAKISVWRRAKNGTWEGVRFNSETKRWIKEPGNGLIIGVRDAYHDYSF